MKIPANYILFSSTPDCPAGIADGKAYIERQNLDSQDIKLVRRNGQILVVTKKPIELGTKSGKS